ncbi:DUF945 family protein [Vibrio algarum]|uniref:DUF945 family protein n=1 Tax=Vibrio algarum TaxID=3020714 RepID=A0ABT4YQW9_9VIBR|nr:DUF945 family protein [Vibrio sp. KJ40-1]MDB1123952.1 DUF945 family protein [Vibrio sp. KJ40-1]
MQQLKKYGAIGGALVLVACWPLAVGQIAQNVLKDAIGSLNSSELSAEVVNYDRGYLSAVASTKYIIKDPALKEQFLLDGLPTEFTLKHNIKHGLIRVATDTNLIDFDELPATLTTITQLNGNTEFALNIENVNYDVPDSSGTSLYLAASQISGSATVLGELDLEFKFPALQVHFDTGESINVSSITGYAKGKKVNGFWHGEQQVNITDSAMLSPDGSVHTSATDFSYKFSSSTNETGERLDTNHIVKAGNVVTSDGELNNLNVDFSIGHLDKVAFEGLVGLYQSNPTVDETVLGQSLPLIDKLFNQGFQIALNNLDLTLGAGQFTSKWLLEVPQGTTGVSQDFSKVITVLTGNLNSYVSNGLVETYPYLQEGIDEMVIMEIMQPTDDGYTIDATISDGNLEFASGQKIPLVAMFMSMMM